MALISRRTVLAGLGGGVATASLSWALGWPDIWTSRPIDRNVVGACCSYADYAGWLVTTKDKETLMARASMPVLEGIRFEGAEVGSERVETLDECAGWCLTRPDCQGFTYGHADHPKADLRKLCSLKQSSEITKVPDSKSTSGTR